MDRIRWESVFPAFQILRAARISLSLSMLLPALLAILISDLAVRVFPEPSPATSEEHQEGQKGGNLNAMSAVVRAVSTIAVPVPVAQLIRDIQSLLFRGILDTSSRWVRILVHLAVLSLFGLTVCCTAASLFCRQHCTNLQKSVRAASSTISALSVSAGLSLLLIFVPLSLLRITQSLAAWTGAWQWLPSVVFAVLWLSAMLIVLISVVVGFGWLLGICAIAADRCSGADALSRGINYVLSHPLMSMLYGVLLLLTIASATTLLQAVSDGAVSLVIGFDSAGSILPVQLATAQDVDPMSNAKAMRTFPELVVEAYRFCIFFCGLTIAYILLRQREDSVDPNELQNTV